jgi:hypothetical protein
MLEKRGKNRNNEYQCYSETIKDGIIPQKAIDMTERLFVEDVLGLCNICDLGGRISEGSSNTHILVDIPNEKYTCSCHCPVLFYDLLVKCGHTPK